jgi:hypothetical protein
MRSLKSGLLGCVVAGFIGTFVVVGCSASGDTGDITEPTTNTDPTEDEGGAVLPPENTNPDDNGDDEPTPATDAGKKDAGKDAGKDAAKDSGPPTPQPGDSCTTVDQTFKKMCGKCGSQEALCLANNTVSDYGVCTNETGECTPGATEPCGNCGTRTCTSSCSWGSCTNQPQNSCSPGALEYSTAGCTTAQTYRERTCGATCIWGNFSGTCVTPNNPLKLTISGTVTGTVNGTYSLSANKLGKRSPSSCPGSPTTGSDYPYEIVEVKNATTKTATITAYLSGTPAIDTVLTAYQTNLQPATDAELGACATANDQCPSGLTGCTSPWSGLTGANAVTIPAGQAVLLRIVSWYAVNTADETTTGSVKLTVRTDALN